MPELTEEECAYARLLEGTNTSIRDLDLVAFARGIMAYKSGAMFHENPYGTNTPSVARLSWSMGWNERALQCPK